jgi:hypothetical protein
MSGGFRTSTKSRAVAPEQKQELRKRREVSRQKVEFGINRMLNLDLTVV